MTQQERASPKKVHVIACGALAREILAIRSANGLDHIELQCLPAILHVRPDRITPAVQDAVRKARASGATRIFLAYADCGTGGMLDDLCRREGIERIAGPHCYAFFSGNEAFGKHWGDDVTSFFLTDFLARQFEAFVVEPLGLNRHPELRDMYFGNYRKLVYLAQTEDPQLRWQAEQAAERLELAFEYRFTGYGDLVQALQEA